MSASTHAHMQACTQTHPCMHIHTYACIHTHTNMHAHMHTQAIGPRILIVALFRVRKIGNSPRLKCLYSTIKMTDQICTQNKAKGDSIEHQSKVNKKETFKHPESPPCTFTVKYL